MLKLTQILIVTTLMALGSIVTISKPSYGQEPTFRCKNKGGNYITEFTKRDGRTSTVMTFISTEFPPPYDNLKTSCMEISSRIQRSYDNGTLKRIVAGKMQKRYVICSVKSTATPCNSSNLLFTLKPGTTGAQAQAIAEKLFNGRDLSTTKGEVVRGTDTPYNFNTYLENVPSE